MSARKAELKGRAMFFSRVIQALFLTHSLSGYRLKQADRAARHLSLGLQLINPSELDKALKMAENIALSSNTEAVLAQRRAGLVVYQFELNRGYWESYTRQDLPTPEAVGLAEKRKPVEFSFDNDPHALVAGSTGSGKTEALKSILIALMTVYKPDELKLIVADPNHMLIDFDNVAHLALPIARTVKDMQAALLFCNQELAKRKAENIKASYRLCLVLDEATETLLTEQDLAIVKTIAKQGRGFKVNLLLGTQEPTQKDLPGIVNLLLNRYVGKVRNAQQSTQLTGFAGLQAHKLTGKGDFIHVANGGDATRFQVAQATKTDFNKLERVEVKPVEVTPDMIELPTALPEKPPGRPRLEIEPNLIGWYLHHNPQRISIKQAQELMGLTRSSHNLHKGFTIKIIETLKQLKGVSQ